MWLEESAGSPLEPATPQPSVAEQPLESLPPRRSHLVAIVTRALAAGETTEQGASIRARYWNPHLHRWAEDDYASIDRLRRRHMDEDGWELLQEQPLDGPDAVELIFRAHRVDFVRPSREQILRDIGMTPDDVNQLLEGVDRRQDEA